MCDGEIRLSGFDLDDMLIERGVYAELPEMGGVTFAVSMGNERAHIQLLLKALHEAAAEGRGEGGGGGGGGGTARAAAARVASLTLGLPAAVADACTPREAYFNERVAVHICPTLLMPPIPNHLTFTPNPNRPPPPPLLLPPPSERHPVNPSPTPPPPQGVFRFGSGSP